MSLLSHFYIFLSHLPPPFLAGDFDLDVDITTAGDVLLQLTLLAPVPGEVRLRIKYTSPDSTEPHTRTSNEAYINASRITADVRNSDVPYQQFKVQVALIVGNQQGPFVPESLDSALTYGETPTCRYLGVRVDSYSCNTVKTNLLC